MSRLVVLYNGFRRLSNSWHPSMAALLYGDRIEEYEVFELLGKGGFAQVYRAQCRRSGAAVAVKMIDKALMARVNLVERVRQEVGIHSRLKHPSILELYKFFEDARYVYLILEIAHNGELAKYYRLDAKGLSERLAADILRQIVEGILYLHSHNIVHRDLSLNNLLLTKDLRVKIADFGLATQINEPEERHVTMCGTPNYISPEVASRSRHGLPVDIWGLGCILYTLLVGKPPFGSQSVKNTLDRVVQGSYQMPSNLSSEARDLLDKLLRKNPAERISLDRVVRHPFLTKNEAPSGFNADDDSGFHNTMQTTQSTQHRLRTMSCNRLTNSIEASTSSNRRPASFNVFTDVTNSNDAPKHEKMDLGSSRHFSFENRENAASVARSIGVPPLCTARLNEISHRTRNAELSITAEGVTVKFIRKKGRLREDRVIEVCTVSKDGMQVVIYPVGGNKGIPLNEPLPTHTHASHEVFTYHNLPQKYWKKYLYASRFVDLVKAKTPKITFYSERAKCNMMESGTDFIGKFYSGEKFTQSECNGLKIEDARGNTLYNPKTLDSDLQETYEHFQECMAKCVQLESALNGFSEDCFPICAGSRPVVSKDSPRQTPNVPNMSSINIGSFRNGSIAHTKSNNTSYSPFGGTFNPSGDAINPFKTSTPTLNPSNEYKFTQFSRM